MINVTINGIPVQLEKPMRVIDAAKKVGIHVPHFCYHPELTVHAGCRICMIEVKGRPKLMAGCAVIMSDGMEVVTESEKISEARRGVLELQLAHHPLDCPECDKGGECLLQDYALKYSPNRTRFREPKRKIPVNYENPLIERNMERCVACKRCVRICAEIQGDWVLSDMHRGAGVIYGSFCGDEAECVHCGHCISTCPVGAIQSRLYKHTNRPWYVEREAETICPYCGDGCTMTLQTRGNKILRVLSDETFTKAANRGSLCVRGRFGADFPNSRERLASPLIKKDGYFVEASWEEAASFVAERLSAIKSSAGPGAIGAISGGRNTNEENYLLGKFMRASIGTNNIDNMASLGHMLALTALEQALGVPAMTNSIKDIGKARAVLLIGNDAAAENPITGLAIKKAVIKNEASLIVADAGRNAMDKHADARLTYRPGTAYELVQGMMNVIFAEGLNDKETEEKHADTVGRIKSEAESHTPESVSAATGVPAVDIIGAARTFAGAKPACIVFGSGVTAAGNGIEAARALASLSIITGNVGKPGGGVNPLASKAGEQGACDMGMLPDRLPGYASVGSEADTARLGALWNAEISSEPGMGVSAMMEAAAAGKLHALYVMGANPAFELPGREKTAAALKKIKLLVVQDIFMSETAELADVVLPAASYAEKEGTFTNSERRVQRIVPVMDLVGGSRPDGEIIAMVSEKAGRPLVWEPAAVMDEIAEAVPSYAGLGYALLSKGGVQWPLDAKTGSGTQVLHADGFTPAPSKEAPVQAAPSQDAAARDTGRQGAGSGFFADITTSLYHCGTTSRRARGPNMIVDKAHAIVNPADAQRLGLSEGDSVKVLSATGEMALPVKLDPGVPGGMVQIHNHFQATAASALTEPTPGGARFWPVTLEKQ